MAGSNLSSFYSSQPLVLWVEDEETQAVLTTAFAGDSIAIHIGGGNQTIRATVEDAWRGGIAHVFGVVDRDFGKSNYANWAAPRNDMRMYVLQSPEVENLALDPVSLAACVYNTARRSVAEVDTKMKNIVENSVWWMACCCVLVGVGDSRNDGFPKFPKYPTGATGVGDLSSAIRHIMDSKWFKQTAHSIPALADAATLETRIVSQHDRLRRAIFDGTWNLEFSGKQILRQLSGFVYPGNDRQKHVNLIKAVIGHQKDNGGLPNELIQLRSSLMNRCGLSP